MLTNEVYAGTLLWGSNGKYHQQANLEPVRVEKACPALVDRRTFDQVQRMLRSRAPKVVPPRRVSSPYLLSGVLRCGTCGATMFGHGAKSGRYHYYVCATAHRNGKQLCDAAPVPQALIEARVLDKVRGLILKQKHIEELVRLTNEELQASLDNVQARLGSIDSQVSDVGRRLDRLYDALETGRLDLV